jgi:hypothetical protein
MDDGLKCLWWWEQTIIFGKGKKTIAKNGQDAKS